MANSFNEDFMRRIARAELNWAASGGSAVRAALGDAADDSPVPASDVFVSDITAAALEERTGTLTLIDAADDGVLDLADFVFAAAAGDPCEWLLFYKFVTVDTDSPQFLHFDTATGLPVTLNGGDVNVTVHASGLCKI